MSIFFIFKLVVLKYIILILEKIQGSGGILFEQRLKKLECPQMLERLKRAKRLDGWRC